MSQLMTRQIQSNPLKDPELPARFARLLARYMIKLSVSDEQLVRKMNDVAGVGSGSPASVRRHKDGSEGSPSYRMIGIYKDALGIPDNEIDLLLDPNRSAASAATPAFSDMNEQWQQLVEYLKRQSQLPHHIQNERTLADAAVKERDYDRAKQHLEKVSKWTYDSYREHEATLSYAAEEYERALASLGALAFTSMDFADARAQYAKLLDLTNLTPDKLSRYRRYYLGSSNALIARLKSEDEARAVLKEMTDNGVVPNVVSYNSLMNFVESEDEARAVLKEMTDNDVAPDVVSYNSLMNFVKSEDQARAIMKEMTDNNIMPDEITVISAIKTTGTFENGLGLIDFCLVKNYFVGQGAFQAAFSKSITHLTAEELLTEYHARKFKYGEALEGPINQYRRARRIDFALMLVLVAPHVGAAQKLYREKYSFCRDFFQAQIASGNDEDNVYFALGIAATLNGDWEIARPNLKIALERSYAVKRSNYVKELLTLLP